MILEDAWKKLLYSTGFSCILDLTISKGCVIAVAVAPAKNAEGNFTKPDSVGRAVERLKSVLYF